MGLFQNGLAEKNIGFSTDFYNRSESVIHNSL
ncbi:hypothetical protein GGI64_003083 [Rhizobium leguminosarum]|uniref:Uncharacterized protein n=1 Tax=Rhizobium leguminosarum TaxID=384 RepID=A0A7Z0DZV9_RHILE|nr:hypothetical protein [Rhizobium leguminosarum]